MANTTNLRHICQECGFCDKGFCCKINQAIYPTQYACHRFKTPKELAAEVEQRKKEILDREETRLNFILTALYISATSTQMLLEYFDAQFGDAKVERNWRFARKRAANDITDAANRMRTIFQHTFMDDQTKVMTAQGTKPFDAKAYDNHEADARGWALNLLYHLDRCWQDDDAELKVLDYYKALPDNGIFDRKDYEHFRNR